MTGQIGVAMMCVGDDELVWFQVWRFGWEMGVFFQY